VTGGMTGQAKDEHQGRAEAASAVNAAAPQPAPRRATWRDRLYGRLKVSVRTMDLVIIGLVAALAVVLLLGVVTAGR